ncbi:F-box protein At1g30200 isoform X1 [Coffea arabica]|uniref:F-box protein At1g30200 isoform X1 n=2 Tax=Coffea arabica TaxID=13443 RepID=A0ABM4UUE1_COFAR
MPKEALKCFRAIRNLQLNLPNPTSDSCLSSMIWKAEFGSKLDYILALHAKDTSEFDESYELCSFDKNSDSGDSGESSMFMKDEEFDKRLTMILACLVVASARRLLFRETLKDHQTLQNVTISDEKQIGTFSMNRRQIEEFKRGMNSRDWIKKTLVESDKSTPFFRMKVWDVPELKLSGCTMKGVTLVVIERIEEENKKVEESWDWVVKTFDGEGEKEKVFNEAVRKLFEKKRSYISREMNSSFDILQ